MILRPSKKIVTSRHNQRGNICIGLGFPPTRLVDVNGDYVDTGLPSGGGGWTLEQEWDYDLNGDMVAIWNAFQSSGGPVRARTLAWSPDGSKLTLCSSSADDTKVFTCSTAFDPNTAVQSFSFGVVNPSWGFYNRAGNRFVDNVIVGDVYQMYTASGFQITSGTPIVDNNISKADVGWNGATDAPAVFGPDFTYMLWYGLHNTNGEGIKNISIPAGDLGSFVVEETYSANLDVNNSETSPIDLSETAWMRGKGSQGIAFITLDSPREVSSIVEGTPQSVAGLTSLRPDAIWFDRDDTTYVWAAYDGSNNFRLAKFATNVPSN